MSEGRGHGQLAFSVAPLTSIALASAKERSNNYWSTPSKQDTSFE